VLAIDRVSFTTSTVRGVSISGASFVVSKGVSAVLYLWVASLLGPTEMGVVTFGLAVYAMYAPFRDFGITTALIARKELSQQLISSAYTYRIVIAILLTASGFVVSFVLPMIFPLENLFPILILVTMTLWIEPLGFLSAAMLNREFEFKKLAYSDLIAASAMAATVILFALLGYGLYALFIGACANAAARTAVYLHFRPMKATITRDLKRDWSVVVFGSKLAATGVILYIFFNMNVWVLGKSDVVALGLYGFAFLWATTPSEVQAAATSRVLLPTYSALKSDPKRIVRGFLKSQRFLYIFSLAAVLGILVFAPIVIDFLYSSSWDDAVPIMIVLLGFGFLRMISIPANALLLAFERSGEIMWSSLISMLIAAVPAYPVALSFGALGCAYLLVLAYLVYVAITWYLAIRLTNVGAKELLSSIASPTIAAAVAAGIWIIAWVFAPGMSATLLTVVLVIPAYCAALYALSPEDFRQSLSYLRESISLKQ
jgi:O-antigen/teichoic acid export membrane protein